MKSDAQQGYAACLLCEAQLTSHPNHRKNLGKQESSLTLLFYEKG